MRTRPVHVVEAGIAWFGALLALAISVLGLHVAPTPGSAELVPGGLGEAFRRAVGTVSYFTWMSNAMVAVSATMLAVRPTESTPVRRVVRLTGMLMITVTFVVYHVLLAPNEAATGIDLFAKNWQHIVTPVTAWVVWVWVGPRRWISRRTVVGSLLVPVAWVLWTLARGAVTGTYPYFFLDVNSLGYAQALANIVGVLAFGLVLAALFWLFDVLLVRIGRHRRSTSARPNVANHEGD